jgi:hypothetical protein
VSRRVFILDWSYRSSSFTERLPGGTSYQGICWAFESLSYFGGVFLSRLQDFVGLCGSWREAVVEDLPQGTSRRGPDLVKQQRADRCGPKDPGAEGQSRLQALLSFGVGPIVLFISLVSLCFSLFPQRSFKEFSFSTIYSEFLNFKCLPPKVTKVTPGLTL